MSGFLDKMAGAAKNVAAATGEMAKTAAEKGQDFVEVTKLNNRIKQEQEQIAASQRKIGEIIFERFSRGEEIDDQMKEICQEISAKRTEVTSLNAEIGRLRSE